MGIFTTPRGRRVTIHTRPGTNDEMVARSVLDEDEYQLRDVHLTGWAADIGAHIGAVSIALAVDNPGLSVIAVEPVAHNLAMLYRNIAANNLGDYVLPLGGVAGDPVPVHSGHRGNDTADIHTYIGNQPMPAGTVSDVDYPTAWTLDDLFTASGAASFSLVKLDCEGCEYGFLRGAAIERVDRYVGEYHRGSAGILAALGGHRVRYAGGDRDGLFWAER